MLGGVHLVREEQDMSEDAEAEKARKILEELDEAARRFERTLGGNEPPEED